MAAQITPPAGLGFSGNNFRSALFTCTKRRGCLCFIHTKSPPVGFGGPIAPYHAPPHLGLCHWAVETAGHLGAESPSRRTAGPASARKASPPCPHRAHGSFRARCANAMSRSLRALPFASSRRSLTRTLGHSQWPKPPRFLHATAPARWRLKSHCPRAIRPIGRYGGARTIRDSPSDVGACHRVVRRHTCCSPATRRSMRATQERAAPGVNVGQPARKAASKLSHEARRSSEECVGSHESHRHGSSWFESFRSHFALFGHFG